jgi:hypothetical protein
MGLNTSALDVMLDALAAAGTYISAHTADPGTNGANEVAGGSYARQQTTWGSKTGTTTRSRTGSQVTIPVPSGTTVTHYGQWSAASAGTFYGSVDIADEVFGSGGNLQVTPTLSQTAS